METSSSFPSRNEHPYWSEDQLRLLLPPQQDILVVCTADGTIAFIRHTLSAQSGFEPESWENASLGNILHPDDQDAFMNTWRAVLAHADVPQVAAYRVQLSPGSWTWAEITLVNHLHTPGMGYIVGSLRPLAYRQGDDNARYLLAHEQAAREEAQGISQRMLSIVTQTPAAICFLRGPKYIYEFANQQFIQLVGHRDLLGKPIREVFPELLNQGVLEQLDHVYTTGIPFLEKELRLELDWQQRGSGEERYFNVVYHPSRDSNGAIDGVLAHYVDVTEQVHQRQKLEKSEARLWRLVNSNVVGVSFTNRKGEILDANENFLEMVGYTREEIATGNLRWDRMTLPEYAARDQQALQEIAQAGAVSRPYEKEYRARDGSRIPVLVGGTSLDASQEEIATFVIDMRPHKEMERELRTAKEQLEAILQNAGDGITVQNTEGTIVFANPVAARMSGFPSVEALLNASTADYQRTLGRFIIKDEAGNVLAQEDFPGRRALREGKSVHMLLQYEDTLTGVTFWSFIKSQPIFLEGSRAHFAVNVLVDLSEQQALEQRKNEFISMASHELKTPVTVLKGFTNILQRRAMKQEDEQALLTLQRMDSQLNKLTKLINDLLDISRIQAGKLALQEELLDLAALLYEIGENIQGTTSTHCITIEATGVISIMGDKDRLSQVLINLLTNAIKYSPQATSVILRAVTDEKCVTVSVQDFGIGIADTYHQQIFQRFYQVTEPQAQTYPGLGIGLYIAHDIIKRHRGDIWVESSKGNGSTFFFTLPLCTP